MAEIEFERPHCLREIGLRNRPDTINRIEDPRLTWANTERCKVSAKFRLNQIGTVKKAVELMCINLHTNSSCII